MIAMILKIYFIYIIGYIFYIWVNLSVRSYIVFCISNLPDQVTEFMLKVELTNLNMI